MWQKERLLNVGLRHLPGDCDKVAWLDADIIFRNDRWIGDASALLESYRLVQPFSRVLRLPEGVTDPDWDRPAAGTEGCETSLHALLRRGIWLDDVCAGFCWCARKDLLERCGFYDSMIVGGGDMAMFRAFTGRCDDGLDLVSRTLRDNFARYKAGVESHLCGSLECLEGEIAHLWHGRMRDRRYGGRHALLAGHGFDPGADIREGAGGCWEWASDKPEMHRYVESYFRVRNEEGKASGKLPALFSVARRILGLLEPVGRHIVERVLPGRFPALRKRYRSWKAEMGKRRGLRVIPAPFERPDRKRGDR
jgi:hypothetical protein